MASARTDKRVLVPVGGAGARATLARLRDMAGRLVAFSETKLVLREAMSTIEGLEGEAERLRAEVTRLTAELARERTGSRTP